MQQTEGAMRAEVRAVVEAEGVEVPRTSWPRLPDTTPAPLTKLWTWQGKYWVDLAGLGFFGPCGSLADAPREIDFDWLSEPYDLDESFYHAMFDMVTNEGETVFEHDQSADGGGSYEWVMEWGGLSWSGSLDHGFSGPFGGVEGALSPEATCVTGASRHINSSEMSADEVVEHLWVAGYERSDPIKINETSYTLVDGELVACDEDDGDDLDEGDEERDDDLEDDGYDGDEGDG